MAVLAGIKEVTEEIVKVVGPVDGITLVYPHQISDGAIVVFRHKNLDAILATARIWLRNSVEFLDGKPYVPVVFGELSFGQKGHNINVIKEPTKSSDA